MRARSTGSPRTGQAPRLARRLLAVATVGVLLLLSACGNTDGKDGGAQSAPRFAKAGTFDECGLLHPDEVAEAVDESDYTVTTRSARPRGKGWEVGCGYGPDGSVGSARVTILVTTHLGQAALGSASPTAQDRRDRTPPVGSAPTPLPQLGDEAWYDVDHHPAVDGKAPVPSRVRVTVRQGSAMLTVRLPLYEDGVAEQVRTAIKLARTAVRRLPTSFHVTPRRIEGQCARVDLDVASTVLKEKLSGARSVTTGDGDMYCSFKGRRASLEVMTTTAETSVTRFEAERVGTPIRGLGDAARFRGMSPIQSLDIRVGERVISVSGISSDLEELTLTRPRPPSTGELALFRSLVEASQ